MGNSEKKIYDEENKSVKHDLENIIVWLTITVVSLLIAGVAFKKMPALMPIQWSGSTATSMVNKEYLFIFPVICIIVRYVIRKILLTRLQAKACYDTLILDYITNYLCFVALSVEVFALLYVYEIIKSVYILVTFDVVVLIAILIRAYLIRRAS